jgi:hypothetical protein
MRAVHSQRGDSAAIHRDHLELAAGNGNPVTHFRKPPELGERISTESRPVSLRDLNAVIGPHIYE